MVDRPGLDFSFSGLKTHTLTTLASTQQTLQDKADVAHAFQAAVVDTLIVKCRRALKQCGFKRLVVAGGVSANRLMRDKLAQMAKKEGFQVFFPRLEFCTDNGAMIAYAGCQRLLKGANEPAEILSRPRWPLDELEPVE